MPTLYYSPGACSLASHQALEEAGAQYETKPVMLAKGEHMTEEYKKVNPRQKVPALKLDDGSVLTENVAILHYVARKHPQANLLPKDEAEQFRCLSQCAWFSNSAQPPFGRIFRPERFSADEDAKDGIRESGKKAFLAALQDVDGMLAGKEWLMGSQFTICDPYALVFYYWGTRVEMPMKDLKSYTAWKDRMLKRPAVRKVLEREKSSLLDA